MRRRQRHSAGTRLVLITAALAAIVVGYYAGQTWQRRTLDGLSATVLPAGRAVDYPPEATPTVDETRWTLFVAVDTRLPACDDLLRHYALVVNRLAPWPKLQARVRLAALADENNHGIDTFAAGVAWADVVSLDDASRTALAQQLGLVATERADCSPAAAYSILVAPDGAAWALIPYEQAAIMAHNISTIIRFVE